MLRPLRYLAPGLLLGLLACQPQGPQPIYGPWEEGLTLAFEDPSQPQPHRSEDRLQARVARSAIQPGPPTQVQLDLTSVRAHVSLLLRHQDGGIALVDPEGRVLAQTLPPGFPKVTAWQERGTTFHVVGRGAWDGAAILPATSPTVGIWVEAKPEHGPRRRTLYLPNLGEVESMEERQGQWVTVNRLVGLGFTDPPILPRP